MRGAAGGVNSGETGFPAPGLPSLPHRQAGGQRTPGQVLSRRKDTVSPGPETCRVCTRGRRLTQATGLTEEATLFKARPGLRAPTAAPSCQALPGECPPSSWFDPVGRTPVLPRGVGRPPAVTEDAAGQHASPVLGARPVNLRTSLTRACRPLVAASSARPRAWWPSARPCLQSRKRLRSLNVEKSLRGDPRPTESRFFVMSGPRRPAGPRAARVTGTHPRDQQGPLVDTRGLPLAGCTGLPTGHPPFNLSCPCAPA